MKRYDHKIYYCDTVENCIEKRTFISYILRDTEFDIIKSKKRFRKFIKEHFFMNNGVPICFQLVDSPNKNFYKIIAYKLESGREFISFHDISDNIVFDKVEGD